MGISCSLMTPYFDIADKIEQYEEKETKEKESEEEYGKEINLDEVILSKHFFLVDLKFENLILSYFQYIEEIGSHLPNVPYPPPDWA